MGGETALQEGFPPQATANPKGSPDLSGLSVGAEGAEGERAEPETGGGAPPAPRSASG